MFHRPKRQLRRQVLHRPKRGVRRKCSTGHHVNFVAKTSNSSPSITPAETWSSSQVFHRTPREVCRQNVNFVAKYYTGWNVEFVPNLGTPSHSTATTWNSSPSITLAKKSTRCQVYYRPKHGLCPKVLVIFAWKWWKEKVNFSFFHTLVRYHVLFAVE